LLFSYCTNRNFTNDWSCRQSVDDARLKMRVVVREFFISRSWKSKLHPDNKSALHTSISTDNMVARKVVTTWLFFNSRFVAFFFLSHGYDCLIDLIDWFTHPLLSSSVVWTFAVDRGSLPLSKKKHTHRHAYPCCIPMSWPLGERERAKTWRPKMMFRLLVTEIPSTHHHHHASSCQLPVHSFTAIAWLIHSITNCCVRALEPGFSLFRLPFVSCSMCMCVRAHPERWERNNNTNTASDDRYRKRSLSARWWNLRVLYRLSE